MKVTISEERLKTLIMKIVKSMNIPELYRVSVAITEKNDIIVALWFEFVSNSEFYKKVKQKLEDRIESLIGISCMVLTIPYSEVKYHLREPRNI